MAVVVFARRDVSMDTGEPWGALGGLKGFGGDYKLGATTRPCRAFMRGLGSPGATTGGLR